MASDAAASDALRLAGHFLIAMPGMRDANFSETLTLLCEHNDQGALGFVVNRPTELTLAELFEQQGVDFDPDSPVARQPLYAGGPVETERGFILHSAEQRWEATMPVNEHFALTASRDIIEAVARGAGPRHFLFLLGYAGWGPGQLEGEMADNAWLTTPADPAIVFELPPRERWQAAARRLGIDLHLLNPDAGHA